MAVMVKQMACGLHQAGLKRGEHMIVVGSNRPRLYATMLAAQSLGAIPVPLYQDAAAAECVFPMTNAEVRLCVVEDQEQVDKMLEVRETWRLTQPIISRCVPICISKTSSYRSEKAYKIASYLHLYEEQQSVDIKSLTLSDIISLRRKGYDPIKLIYQFIEHYSLKNKEVVIMFKNIGAGYSAWIQLANFIALSSKTKDK
jgi:long-subunit acyl-CoA synthetase (AMP-forming)